MSRIIVGVPMDSLGTPGVAHSGPMTTYRVDAGHWYVLSRNPYWKPVAETRLKMKRERSTATIAEFS